MHCQLLVPTNVMVSLKKLGAKLVLIHIYNPSVNTIDI